MAVWRLVGTGVAVATLAAGLATERGAHAQTTPAYDPPDTVYASGDEPITEEVRRRLPVTQAFRAFLPVSVDLSGEMPLPGRQGRLPSCSAWAVAYAARAYYTSTYEGRNVRDVANIPSPAYVYHLARGSACTGTSLVRNAEILSRGAPSLASYPYTDACQTPATGDVVSSAADFKVRGYRRVDVTKLDDVKGQLAQANPVLISYADSQAFHRHRGGAVFDETVPAEPNGWHAMTLVGYDDRRQAFRLINSWGQGWGDRGYAWVSYDVFRSRVREAGILDVARPVAPKPPPPAPAPLPPPSPPLVSQAPPAPPPSPAPAPVAASPTSFPEFQRFACAKITGTVRNGRTILSGFVATDEDYRTMRAVVAARPDVLAADVVVAPWPQCEALQTLDAALTASDRPRLEIGDGRTVIREGETLRIGVRAPARPRYLYVSYVQVDGSLVHLVQPRTSGGEPVAAGAALVFGDGTDGRPRASVVPPFGREMVIAIASRTPLFARELPTRQTEREYLSALRRALFERQVAASGTASSAIGGEPDVAASVVMLETRPR